jgi:Pectate lyase superfamily protein
MAMKAALGLVLLWVFCTGCATLAEAVCVGTSVNAFGARGDGHTDDTAAIQNAINAAASAGGGSVVFNVARYFTTGTFIVPSGVILCGGIEGPFDVGFGVNPAATVVGPTLLVTNTSAPFVTLSGLGAGVTDLLFHYPKQVNPSASAPNVYPYTIVAAAPGTKVVRSLVTNAYNFLDIESGRVLAQDLYIGAFNIGVNIDHAHDHVTLRNLLNQVYWDLAQPPGTYPTPIDTWVLSHGVALVVKRVDGIEVHDLTAFSRFAGILLTDSPDTSQNPRCGFGTASDINLDTVVYGAIAIASNSSGYQFSNLFVGGFAPSSQAAVRLNAGGSVPPDVLVNGGGVPGTWALGPFPTPAVGHLTAVQVIGFDLP